MRILIFIALITSSVNISYSQKNFLIGEWKVISLTTSDYSMNAETDSIYSDKDQIKGKISGMAKSMYLNYRFVFDDDNFTQIGEFSVLKLKYNLNLKDSIIELKNDSEDRIITKAKIHYKFEKDLLHFPIKKGEVETLYILKKITN